MCLEAFWVVEEGCEGLDGGGVVDEFVGDCDDVWEACAWCGGGDEVEEHEEKE